MQENGTKRRREFAKLPESIAGDNYVKYLHLVMADICYSTGLTRNMIDTVLFIKDYEFFTIDHLAKAMRLKHSNIRKAKIEPMMSLGLVENVYHRKNFEGRVRDISFEELKYRHAYTTRYRLTEAGRKVAADFYDKLSGRAEICVPSHYEPKKN